MQKGIVRCYWDPLLACKSRSTINRGRFAPKLATVRRAPVYACNGQRALQSSSLGRQPPLIRLVLYCSLWYSSSAVFSIVNKQTLQACPIAIPWTISTWQLAVSALLMSFLWITRMHPFPRPSRKFMLLLLPLAFFHTIGHVAACISFSRIAVSFVHVIKASEPIFTVALCGPLLGTVYSARVWFAVLAIMVGCTISAVQEISLGCFDWLGVNTACASNLGMVLRGLYSTQMLAGYQNRNGLGEADAMDGINLFGCISIASLLFCLPVAMFYEGPHWSAAMAAAASTAEGRVMLTKLLWFGGFTYWMYNVTSYMVLNLNVGAITFSFYNTIKRAIIIFAAVCVFNHPMSLLNWLGASIATLGAYIYTTSRISEWSALA